MNEQIHVPKGQLKQQRQEVLMVVRRQKRKRKQLQVTVVSLVAVVVLFTCSVRVSPTIAGYVAKIPGFEPLVDMIAYDKGMKDIVDEEYYEEIGAAVTKNNITLSVVGVVADYTGMNIFTEFSAPFDISRMDYKDVKILQNDEEIEASMSFVWGSDTETKNIEGYFQIVNEAGMHYDSRDFVLEITFEDAQDTTIQVPFTLQNEIAETVTLAQNIPLNVAGQNFTIVKMTMSPLRATLEIELADNNGMQILSLDDLRFFDESGEEWASIKNGIVADGTMRDGHLKMYMQSNYFRMPEKLTLIIGEVAALPKGDDYLVVDFVKQKILSKPQVFDWDILLKDMNFIIEGENDRKHGRAVLGQLVDANGKVFTSDIGSMAINDTKMWIEESFSGAIASPAKVYIDYYPNIIGEDIEVQIK